ncbi:MAG: FAD-dependent oxidoreductase [Hyphomicrobiaceae bacterium]
MTRPVTVVGAGIIGLWTTLVLQRTGYAVRLIDRCAVPFAQTASRYAGAMLAPYCEADGSPPIVKDLGIEALELWRRTYPGIVWNGTLVLAAARDRTELARFARLTVGHHRGAVADLEPDLAGRFDTGLFFSGEGHLVPHDAMTFLLEEARRLGAEAAFGETWTAAGGGLVVDCRGIDARLDLKTLRGVRGERLILRTREIALHRTVRLLHPRHPLYIVPWGDGRFMIGATVIESEETGPVSVRSALELLGMAYTLHPAFGEAEIVDLGVGVRPAFPDNVPKAVATGRHIHVNGAYRHGFLLAPVLAQAVADYLTTGQARTGVVELA